MCVAEGKLPKCWDGKLLVECSVDGTKAQKVSVIGDAVADLRVNLWWDRLHRVWL